MIIPDAIFVLPYPFADHPSFPEGILRRTLEHAGFSVGVISRPDWQSVEPFTALGRPRLFFAIISGPLDSVVANYTAARKRRHEDLYQADGQAFFSQAPRTVSSRIRPDRTVVVYANRLRQAYREVPIVIGGVEATMRRFSHYDFQEDALRRSILLDSRADLLVVGMGEQQLLAVARQLSAGAGIGEIDIPGVARISRSAPAGRPGGGGQVRLPSHEQIVAAPQRLLELQAAIDRATAAGLEIVQPAQNLFIVQKPLWPYTGLDLDEVYGLPYTRQPLGGAGLSPALRMNLFSVTSHRGCFGGCAFCALPGHQGRRVVSRSPASIVREIEVLRHHPSWRGMVSDVGGASAEMYGADCRRNACRRGACLAPQACPQLPRPGQNYLELLRGCRKIAGVKKIFVGSGLRFDLLLAHPQLLEEIMRWHCGRFLRVAPEHSAADVLRLMGKPPFAVFEEFLRLFRSINRRMTRKIELALYLVVGHPGERPEDVADLKKKLAALKLGHLDVQIFTPTPGTLATAMFVAGLDPAGRAIPVERSIRELERRKSLLT